MKKILSKTEIKVRVYITEPPHFRTRFQYSKSFCSIPEAQKWILEKQLGRINFDNFMGYCKLSRQEFKIAIITHKEEPICMQVIHPQYKREY